MLVLARQRDETIMIGDDVEVTVVDIRGDKVRLGINAPKSVSVHRKEVYDAIQREKRDTAKQTPTAANKQFSLVVMRGPVVVASIHVPSGLAVLRDDEIDTILDKYATGYAVERNGLRGVYCPSITISHLLD